MSRRILTAGLAGLATDIIAITAVRDLDNVRGAIAAGVVQYLIKAFTYSTFATKSNSYRDFRAELNGHTCVVTQSAVHHAVAPLEGHALAVREVRRALLDEGGHSFALVLGGEHRVKEASLQVDAAAQRRLVRRVDDLLGEHRDRR